MILRKPIHTASGNWKELMTGGPGSATSRLDWTATFRSFRVPSAAWDPMAFTRQLRQLDVCA